MCHIVATALWCRVEPRRREYEKERESAKHPNLLFCLLTWLVDSSAANCGLSGNVDDDAVLTAAAAAAAAAAEALEVVGALRRDMALCVFRGRLGGKCAGWLRHLEVKSLGTGTKLVGGVVGCRSCVRQQQHGDRNRRDPVCKGKCGRGESLQVVEPGFTEGQSRRER